MHTCLDSKQSIPISALYHKSATTHWPNQDLYKTNAIYPQATPHLTKEEKKKKRDKNPMAMFQKLSFLLHLLVETGAALSFLLTPTSQLPGASPSARLILRNLGGLLLSTNLLCLVFLAQPGFDATAGQVALCLGSYHVWPIYRAYARLRYGIGMHGAQGGVFGGPAVHLVAHVACLGALVGMGLVGVWG
ncbi:hypothetical protein B0T22DRAFT_285106 [Podospora appendiculata]|uniref:Uncharacterized protein n=1 Tax=Podospora appendiculata TaxID=314037 RepID=A0AAE0X145_9PEZI|nr:hypothetical protein B0T22DRAFT_285106 [Podospora appendiculata]